MRHASLPSKLTIEQLAVWITENKIDVKILDEKIALTETDIQDHEHKIAVATAAIIDLKAIEKEFKDTIKKGTPANANGELQPVDFTVPPTKGVEKLTAVVEYNDSILKTGYYVNHKDCYGIPYPEAKRVIYVDIEGDEVETFSRSMSLEETKQYGTLFVGKAQESMFD